jgi:hypothetical protein
MLKLMEWPFSIRRCASDLRLALACHSGFSSSHGGTVMRLRGNSSGSETLHQHYEIPGMLPSSNSMYFLGVSDRSMITADRELFKGCDVSFMCLHALVSSTAQHASFWAGQRCQSGNSDIEINRMVSSFSKGLIS